MTVFKNYRNKIYALFCNYLFYFIRIVNSDI